MTQHSYNFHYRQWFYNFFINLYPCVEDRGSSPVNHIFTSNNSNMPDSTKNFLVFQIILKITARIPYECNVLLRFVLHLIWLIIQKEGSGFTWAKFFYMPITLTFKALSGMLSTGPLPLISPIGAELLRLDLSWDCLEVALAVFKKTRYVTRYNALW